MCAQSQPWTENPFTLVSWSDMERFAAAQFCFLVKSLAEMKHAVARQMKKGPDASIGLRGLDLFCEKSIEICDKLGLNVSVRAAVHLRSKISDESKVNLPQLYAAMDHLEKTIDHEMLDTLFFHVTSSSSKFYDQPLLFGKTVSRIFPSLQSDMVEAGNCYALGRGTACVFHLMRIMEVGVQRFGEQLGVNLTATKNWQNILDEANRAIKALSPKDDTTVALSQIAANLYAVKLAWRNEVMHPNDTYTLEEAENILRQVRLFMQNLATI